MNNHCKVTDCASSSKRFIAGYCNAHYLQMQRHGKILQSRTKEFYHEKDGIGYIKLTGGQWAMIDPKDYKGIENLNFHCNNQGYAIGSNRDHASLHRIILGEENVAGYFVDHINHDPLDNRRSNLRICTPGENRRNSKPNKNTSSRHKGVSWEGCSRKWKAYIRIDDSLKNLGRYESEEDAAIAYNVAAQLFFKEFAYLNNI